MTMIETLLCRPNLTAPLEIDHKTCFVVITMRSSSTFEIAKKRSQTTPAIGLYCKTLYTRNKFRALVSLTRLVTFTDVVTSTLF